MVARFQVPQIKWHYSRFSPSKFLSMKIAIHFTISAILRWKTWSWSYSLLKKLLQERQLSQQSLMFKVNNIFEAARKVSAIFLGILNLCVSILQPQSKKHSCIVWMLMPKPAYRWHGKRFHTLDNPASKTWVWHERCDWWSGNFIYHFLIGVSVGSILQEPQTRKVPVNFEAATVWLT